MSRPRDVAALPPLCSGGLPGGLGRPGRCPSCVAEEHRLSQWQRWTTCPTRCSSRFANCFHTPTCCAAWRWPIGGCTRLLTARYARQPTAQGLGSDGEGRAAPSSTSRRLPADQLPRITPCLAQSQWLARLPPALVEVLRGAPGSSSGGAAGPRLSTLYCTLLHTNLLEARWPPTLPCKPPCCRLQPCTRC